MLWGAGDAIDRRQLIGSPAERGPGMGWCDRRGLSIAGLAADADAGEVAGHGAVGACGSGRRGGDRTGADHHRAHADAHHDSHACQFSGQVAAYVRHAAARGAAQRSFTIRVVELSSSSTTSERERRKSLKDLNPSDFSENDGSIRFI